MQAFDAQDLPTHPQDGYDVIRAEAARLAGAPSDIIQRILVHHDVYRDSSGNHAFPLIALHGALWAARFFETTGYIGDALRVRYFHNSRERGIRMAILNGFAQGFKAVNREVFIDTFTNYYYTKHYGEHPNAGGALHPDLFIALNAVHEATRSGVAIAPARKRLLFLQALQHEQEVTVAPGVKAEIEKFDCPILKFLCLRPLVHLSYFPRSSYLFFRNFADANERIEKAMRSYDLAARIGWPRVEAALGSSRLLPKAYLENPSLHLNALSTARESQPIK